MGNPYNISPILFVFMGYIHDNPQESLENTINTMSIHTQWSLDIRLDAYREYIYIGHLLKGAVENMFFAFFIGGVVFNFKHHHK